MMRLVKLFLLMLALMGIIYLTLASEKSSLTVLSSELVVQGQKALGEEQYPQAILLLEQAIVADPNNAMAFANLGNAYRDAGNQQRAHLYYKRSLERNPNALEVLYQQALLWLAENDADTDEQFPSKITRNLDHMERICSYCSQTLSLIKLISQKNDKS